jgi:hypothetical protein
MPWTTCHSNVDDPKFPGHPHHHYSPFPAHTRKTSRHRLPCCSGIMPNYCRVSHMHNTRSGHQSLWAIVIYYGIAPSFSVWFGQRPIVQDHCDLLSSSVSRRHRFRRFAVVTNTGSLQPKVSSVVSTATHAAKCIELHLFEVSISHPCKLNPCPSTFQMSIFSTASDFSSSGS